ncbi:MAG: peptidase M23 [Gammaproteobacteria bacterium]|nr:MAG: peptidase M23 [Gammaproteobacteria bacterium]
MTCPTDIPRDFKPSTAATPARRLPRMVWFLCGFVLAAASLLLALPSRGKAPATGSTAPPDVAGSTPVPSTASPAPAADVPPAHPAEAPPSPRPPDATTALPKRPWRALRVRRGDSLARIFRRAGLSAQALQALLAQANRDQRRALRHLYPGQRIRLLAAPDGDWLSALEFEQDPLSTLRVECTAPDACRFEHRVRTPERRLRQATAVIHRSLFLAAQKAGLSDALTMALAGIFGWDIDFALDIRQGDRFTVLYEEHRLDGRRIGKDVILAAEFVNRGRVHRAVRYTDPRGHTDYYTPDGHSMRRAFLRTPVAFTRISSRFTLGRMHPILHRIRAHKGVDYAAPYGTPVKATGDGKVVFAGWKGGYGRVIVLRHGSRYSTLYAHLSRFARGIRAGRTVHQGQVIGYVGKSGLATGPHLHYEFRIDGVHHNPLTVRLPAAAPIDRRYLDDFRRKTRPLLAALDGAHPDGTQVAMQP